MKYLRVQSSTVIHEDKLISSVCSGEVRCSGDLLLNLLCSSLLLKIINVPKASEGHLIPLWDAVILPFLFFKIAEKYIDSNKGEFPMNDDTTTKETITITKGSTHSGVYEPA